MKEADAIKSALEWNIQFIPKVIQGIVETQRAAQNQATPEPPQRKLSFDEAIKQVEVNTRTSFTRRIQATDLLQFVLKRGFTDLERSARGVAALEQQPEIAQYIEKTTIPYWSTADTVDTSRQRSESRTSRVEGMSVTERDLDILKDLGRFGGLTVEQIGLIHFGVTLVGVSESNAEPSVRTHSNAANRIKLLHESGFVKRTNNYQFTSSAGGRTAYFYSLTKEGIALYESTRNAVPELVKFKGSRGKDKEALIHVNDFRIALERSVKTQNELSVRNWKYFPELGHDIFPPSASFRLENALRVGWDYYLYTPRRLSGGVLPGGVSLLERRMTQFEELFDETGTNGTVLFVDLDESTRKIDTFVNKNRNGQWLFSYGSMVDMVTPRITEPAIQDNAMGKYTVELPDILTDTLWLTDSKARRVFPLSELLSS